MPRRGNSLLKVPQAAKSSAWQGHTFIATGVGGGLRPLLLATGRATATSIPRGQLIDIGHRVLVGEDAENPVALYPI